MHFEQPLAPTSKESALKINSVKPAPEILSTEVSPDELSKQLVAIARRYGPVFSDKVTDGDQDLKERFGRDRLLNSPLYHAMIGSTPWPGLNLVEDEPVKQAIVALVEDLKNNLPKTN